MPVNFTEVSGFLIKSVSVSLEIATVHQQITNMDVMGYPEVGSIGTRFQILNCVINLKQKGWTLDTTEVLSMT